MKTKELIKQLYELCNKKWLSSEYEINTFDDFVEELIVERNSIEIIDREIFGLNEDDLPGNCGFIVLADFSIDLDFTLRCARNKETKVITILLQLILEYWKDTNIIITDSERNNAIYKSLTYKNFPKSKGYTILQDFPTNDRKSINRILIYKKG